MAKLTRLALILLLVSAWSAQAQTPLPALKGPVNDFAGVIDAASAAELDRVIRALQQASGDVLVVATVNTLAPYGSIEEYALRMFEQAGIGTAVADNGALILVAVQDRKVRIEVGYGLEEFITDGYAGDTIRTYLLPAFREGNYGAGLVEATNVLARRLAEARGVTLTDVAPVTRDRQGEDDDGGGGAPFFIGLLIFLLINWISRHSGGGRRALGRRGGRGTWSGWHGGIGGFGGGFGSGGFGGGGGGFGGFGGGSSGGGGASGGW